MEIAASLHFLSAADGLEGEDVIRKLVGRKPGLFTRKECADVQRELRGWQLLR